MSSDVVHRIRVSAVLAKPLSLGAERLLEMGIGDDRDEACAGPCDGSLIGKHSLCLKKSMFQHVHSATLTLVRV